MLPQHSSNFLGCEGTSLSQQSTGKEWDESSLEPAAYSLQGFFSSLYSMKCTRNESACNFLNIWVIEKWDLRASFGDLLATIKIACRGYSGEVWFRQYLRQLLQCGFRFDTPSNSFSESTPTNNNFKNFLRQWVRQFFRRGWNFKPTIYR